MKSLHHIALQDPGSFIWRRRPRWWEPVIVVSVLTVAMLSALWPTVIKPAVATMLVVGSCVEDRLVDTRPLVVKSPKANSEGQVQVAGGPLQHWSRTLRSYHLDD